MTRFTPSTQDAVSMIAIALSLVAITVAPALASEPAAGDAQARHCVQSASQGGQGAPTAQEAAPPQCFVSFSEAISFATGRAVVIPDNLDFEQQLDVLGDSLASLQQDKAVNDVVLAVDYNYKNYKAGTLTWEGHSGNCVNGGRWYYANSIGDGWNNKTSSTRGYADCGQNIVFEGYNRTGTIKTCWNDCSDLGALANEVSSREWRY
jgi:hypothetical protein